jgi:hypothetical protein
MWWQTTTPPFSSFQYEISELEENLWQFKMNGDSARVNLDGGCQEGLEDIGGQMLD